MVALGSGALNISDKLSASAVMEPDRDKLTSTPEPQHKLLQRAQMQPGKEASDWRMWSFSDIDSRSQSGLEAEVELFQGPQGTEPQEGELQDTSEGK